MANSVDPDQMPQNVASDQGLHCLLLACLSNAWVYYGITKMRPWSDSWAFPLCLCS